MENLQEIEKRLLELGKSIEKCQLEAIELNKQWWNLKQMQPKEKNYTWEECFSKKGFFIEEDSALNTATPIMNLKGLETHKNVATTEKVCKSHLAACMLSHIIEAINKDFLGQDDYIICCEYDDGVIFYPMLTEFWALPYLKSEDGAKCLIKHHSILLKQFFGVE